VGDMDGERGERRKKGKESRENDKQGKRNGNKEVENVRAIGSKITSKREDMDIV